MSEELQTLIYNVSQELMDEFFAKFAYLSKFWPNSDDIGFHGHVVFHQENEHLIHKEGELQSFNYGMDSYAFLKVELEEITRMLRSFKKLKAFL